MALSNKKTMVSTNRLKERVAKLLQEMIDGNASDEYKALAQEWIDNKEDADKTKEIAPKLRKCIAESATKGCASARRTSAKFFAKRSVSFVAERPPLTATSMSHRLLWVLTTLRP